MVHDRGLFDELEQPYNAKEWQLLVDSSKENLKTVLLHIVNTMILWDND